MTSKKYAAVFLFDGVEECEALIVVDLLRRADIDVDIVSIGSDLEICGSHNIRIIADIMLEDMRIDKYDLLLLPGGAGANRYEENEKVCDILRVHYAKNKFIAAICAAPYILAKLGILKGKNATCYPSVKNILIENRVIYIDVPVTMTDKIITGKALGAAVPFAAEIITHLLSKEKAEEVLDGIYYS